MVILFAIKGNGSLVELGCCDECSALVSDDGAIKHAYWHEREAERRMRADWVGL